MKKTVSCISDALSASILIGVINDMLSDVSCPENERRQVDTASDEIISNIVDYAYPNGPGPVVMDCEIPSPGTIVIRFSDRGIPFNPLDHADPDTGVPSENGGLGIFIAKNIMDSISYEFDQGWNRLSITKKW